MTKYQMMANVASALTILAFSYVVFGVHMTKETKHLSFVWIVLILLAQVLILLYGVINNQYEVYGPSIILAIGLMYILYVKATYEVNDKIETELKEKEIL